MLTLEDDKDVVASDLRTELRGRMDSGGGLCFSIGVLVETGDSVRSDG
jgi:hypothetical protein